jgi:hypothetical protein
LIVHVPTDEPALEQVAMKADCAALANCVGHMLAMADCTLVASLPQIEGKSVGAGCSLTAESRQPGGVAARTRTATEAKADSIIDVFIFGVVFVLG